jgi:hypothetical protein
MLVANEGDRTVVAELSDGLHEAPTGQSGADHDDVVARLQWTHEVNMASH